MSRELIPRVWCDRCDAAEVRTEASHTYTVGLVVGENRPALKVLDLCDECDATLAELQDLLAKHSFPLDPAVARPAKPAETYVASEPTTCEICAVTITRGALVGHVWVKHRPGESRPPQPARCPDCREMFSAAGMGMHRARNHGWSALDEAYSGAR